MDPLNYRLLFLGGGVCLLTLVCLVATHRIVRTKALPARLAAWVAAGLFLFGGSQIVGKGIVGWWPFLGMPEVFVHLVKVEVSAASGRVAVIAFAGFKGQAVQSEAKVFVADRDGKDIAEVCGGTVMDVRWSKNGEQLYLLRSGAGRQDVPSKSLWVYTPATREMTYVRELARLATVLSFDPAEKRLLFTAPRPADTEGRVLLVEGDVSHDREDRAVCWREGWQGGQTWGPKTGNMFISTNDESSFSEEYGLWMIRDQEGSPKPAAILQMEGIEGIWINLKETHAALFVRRFPPPCVDFDLYLLDMAEGFARPIASGVEWGSAVWDREGKILAFGDATGLKTYEVSTGRVRILLDAPRNWLDPTLPERLKPLSYSPSGDVVFQTGRWRVEKYDRDSGQAKTLLHAGQFRRYFPVRGRKGTRA